jgi:hypothetical protein
MPTETREMVGLLAELLIKFFTNYSFFSSWQQFNV